MDNAEYTVETIETLEELKEIKEDWNRLYNLKKESPIFFSFEVVKIYYETIIKNFNDVKIKIIIVRNKNQLIVAILPFTLETKIYHHLLPIKKLSIKDDYLIGFYSFLTDPQENQEAIFKGVVGYLKKMGRIWDIIKFCSIPENEKLFKVCLSSFTQYYKTEEIETNTLVIDCNREFDEFIKTDMKRKFLIGVKRVIRRLNEMGKLEFVEINEEQSIKNELTYFYDIEDKNWKGEKGTSLKRDHYGEFYKKLALHLSKENKMRLYFLRLNDRYIAGIYAIIDGDICYTIKTGYDADFYRYSPSSVLLYMLFKKLFENKKIKKIDFFGYYYQYEKSFGSQTRKKYDVFVYTNKLRPKVYFTFKKTMKKIFLRSFPPDSSIKNPVHSKSRWRSRS